MSRQSATCPVCGGDVLTQLTENREVRSDSGIALPFTSEFSKCERCGEEFYSKEQARVANRSAVGVLRAANGRLRPNEIIAIRNQYDVTQDDMQTILGFGKKSLVRWENGTVQQSRAADQLLREVRASPAMFYRLADAAGVALPERVAVWAELARSLQAEVASSVVRASTAIIQGVESLSFTGAFTPGKVGWVSAAESQEQVATGASRDQTQGSASPTFLS